MLQGLPLRGKPAKLQKKAHSRKILGIESVYMYL